MTIKLHVKKSDFRLYSKGYPLITEDQITEKVDKNWKEGSIIELFYQDNFIAKGYYGVQNKGIGWLLTQHEDASFDKDFFNMRLEEAILKRQHLFDDNSTNCFRVVNGEGDQLGGLFIDYYDGYYLITWKSEGIYTFKDQVVEALLSVRDCKGIYEKKRFGKRGLYIDGDDLVWGNPHPENFYVIENDVKYRVDLNDGAMTGIFLDQRKIRKSLKENFSGGSKVLNTFSYTGAFSVAAKMGGAMKTVSVDLANRSREKTKSNFLANDIATTEEEIIVEDIYNYFKYAKRKNLMFDVVILDPPSFSRSKKKIFSVEKDYQGLIERAIDITHKGGVIIASTNCSTMTMKTFKRFVKDAFIAKGEKFTIVEEYGLPEDFRTNPLYPESSYLKVLFIEVQ